MTTQTTSTQTLIPALLAHAAKLPPGPYIEDRYQVVFDLDDDSAAVLDKPEYALLPILKTARGGGVVDARPFVDTVKVIFADLLDESDDDKKRCKNFRRIVASSDETAAKAMLTWFDKHRSKTLAKLQKLVVDADKAAKAVAKKAGRKAPTAIKLLMFNVVFTYDRAYLHDLCRDAVEAEVYGTHDTQAPTSYCLATGKKTATARTIPGFSFGGSTVRFSSVNFASAQSFGFEQGNVAPIGIKTSLDLVKAFADLVSWGTRTVVLKQGDDETAATTTSFRAMKYGFLFDGVAQVTWVPGGADPFVEVWTSSAVTAKMADTLFGGKRVVADSTPLYLMQLKANQARVAVVAFESTTVAVAARHLARWQSYMPGVGLKRLQQIVTAKEAKRSKAFSPDAAPVPWLHCHLQQALLLGKPMSRDVLALALHAAQHGAYDRLARAFCGAWLRWNGSEIDRGCFALGRFYGKAARLQQLDGQERGGVFNFLDNPGTFIEQVLRVSMSRAKRVGDKGERVLVDMLSQSVSHSVTPRTHEQRAAFWAGFSSEEYEKGIDNEAVMT